MHSVPPNPTDVKTLLRKYLALGWEPIPVRPRSKVAAVRWKEYSFRGDHQRWGWLKIGANWALRTGNGLVVLDFDDAKTYYAFISKHPLPPTTPVVATHRGYHVYVKPLRPVPSYYSGHIEVKSTGCYVLAPPSVHPQGTPYRWIVPPTAEIPTVDVEALVPPSRAPREGGNAHQTPLTPAQQEEFRRLMGTVGVSPGRNPTFCPWHSDEEGGHPSLSVDWQRGLFKCFSPRCGRQGNLTTLRRIVPRGEREGASEKPVVVPPRGTIDFSDAPLPEAPGEGWELAPIPLHRCHVPLFLRHRHDPRRERLALAVREEWNCRVCGPYRKKVWSRHLGGKLAQADEVYLVECPLDPKAWDALYRRIKRRRGEYARIELTGGQWAVFTTCGEGVPLGERRFEVLQKAIDSATYEHRAISTSRRWQLGRGKGEKESEWEVVGPVPLSWEEAKARLSELGLKGRQREGTGKKTAFIFEFEIPQTWLEQDPQVHNRVYFWLRVRKNPNTQWRWPLGPLALSAD